MKTILDTLVAGNGKERLAVIADIVTIAGVSLATVTGGLFALTARSGKVDINNLVGAAVLSLLGLAFFCCLIAGFVWMMTAFTKPWKTPPGFQSWVKSAFLLVFMCLVLVAGMVFYELISSFRVFS